MTKILINGFSSKAGGGRAILVDYLSQLLCHSQTDSNTYYILTPDPVEYKWVAARNIILVHVPYVFQWMWALGVYYFIYLPFFVVKNKIDVVFNLADIVLPVPCKQVYFFDWAYAVYPDSVVWARMKIGDSLKRRVKLLMMKKTFRFADVTVAQTKTMAIRLQKLYGLRNVRIVPSPVTLRSPDSSSAAHPLLAGNRNYLLCLSNYAPHKNIEILLEVAKILRFEKSDFTIVTTLSVSGNSAVEAFLAAIEKEGLSEYLLNIGFVPAKSIHAVFKSCSSLLFPTLLESYGLPFVEAMAVGKTIITSDFDFTRDVCGEVAFYFDPLDAKSIHRAIHSAFATDSKRQAKIQAGLRVVESLPTWDQAFGHYNECFEVALSIHPTAKAGI
jgi:glycosyltransferase involved in cell wall biosynthesis